MKMTRVSKYVFPGQKRKDSVLTMWCPPDQFSHFLKARRTVIAILKQEAVTAGHYAFEADVAIGV